MTEVVAQDDTAIFFYKTTHPFKLLPMPKVD